MSSKLSLVLRAFGKLHYCSALRALCSYCVGTNMAQKRQNVASRTTAQFASVCTTKGNIQGTEDDGDKRRDAFDRQSYEVWKGPF